MIWQVFLTVLSGVLVYVAGQVFVKFVIDPNSSLLQSDRGRGARPHLLRERLQQYQSLRGACDRRPMRRSAGSFHMHIRSLGTDSGADLRSCRRARIWKLRAGCSSV